MKKTILIILLAFGAVTCFAQKIALTPVTNQSLKAILCNVDTMLVRRGGNTTVILYEVSNPTGSAHTADGEEVSNKFLIAVTDGDLEPDQILYSVGDFYNPKILKFQIMPHDKYLLSIEYGGYKHRKKISLDIGVDKVVVVNR